MLIRLLQLKLLHPRLLLPNLLLSTSSQPSQKVSSNIIENESLAWERFKNAVTDEDINTCYDMSLKDFEYSGIHDLFKVTFLPRLY